MPGMKGTRTSPRDRAVMMAMTSTSPLWEVDMGGIWYHMTYSHNQGCPGHDPVSFIMPH